MDDPFKHAMHYALSIAEKGRWKTTPNPTVGAVLVHEGTIVAEGFHESYGSLHAEIECLNDAKRKNIDPSTCTLVVTLEPCNHHGKTPPCIQSILNTNIKHVIIGYRDPHTLASGGIQYLKNLGITVEVGLLEKECQQAIADFIVWQTTNRPYIFLKFANTLDGKIATRTGHSKWISSETSRNEVHKLRANIGAAHGAILIGGNTLKRDNPQLTCRSIHTSRQPLAIILTSTIPPQKDLFLFNERPEETILYTTEKSLSTNQAKILSDRGIRIYSFDQWVNNGILNLERMLEHIRSTLGCLYILCEGGGKLGSSLLEANLVDEMHIYLSSKILGDNRAYPIFDGRSPLTMQDALSLQLYTIQVCDTDIHLTFRPEFSHVYRNC